MTEMTPTLEDWDEIVSALQLKIDRLEKGAYDDLAKEVNRCRNLTSVWLVHLREILAKIEAQVIHE